jgi:Mn2+/Fe2+ NRAMP family transporter
VFYAAIALSTLIGVLINFIGLDPIKALFWSAVTNGVVAAPLMAIIMLMAMRRDVMVVRMFATWRSWPRRDLFGRDHFPTRMVLNDPSTPKACSSQSTTQITTTALRMLLIFPSMGK